jgi:hypothetical protein
MEHSPQVFANRTHKLSEDEVIARKQSIADQRTTFETEIENRIQNAPSPIEKDFVPKNISITQAYKLKALFEQYFDVDRDGFLTQTDIDALNEKIFKFTEWPRADAKSVRLIDFHKDLFACLLLEANRDVVLDENKLNKISLNAWMKLWDQLMHKALTLAHLPQWVQVLPFNLFQFIDNDGEKRITKKNLLEFYKDFMNLKPEVASIVRDEAYSEMTGNGDYSLDLDLYTTAFNNFLFGKSFYGPGKFVLGTFEQCTKPQEFKIVQG